MWDEEQTEAGPLYEAALTALREHPGRHDTPLPLDFKGNAPAAAFFADLGAQRLRSAAHPEEFLFRTLAVLLVLHARDAGLPIERAPAAVMADPEAMIKAYAHWAHADAAWCADQDSGVRWGGEDVPARFVTALSRLAAEPDGMIRFLAIGGFLRRPAPQRVAAPATPPLVDWDERRLAQSGWMNEIFSAGRTGVFVNNAEPSISKTGAALQIMATHRDKRFLYLGPSHALLLDVYHRAIEAGIPAEEIFVAQGLERLCTFTGREETIFRDARLGKDVKSLYCHADSGRCGLQSTCAWHVQKTRARQARVLLAPSAYLSSANHFAFLVASAWGNDNRDAIFIDDDAASRLCTRVPFPQEALWTYRDALWAFDPPAGGYAEAITARADALLEFAGDPAAARLELAPLEVEDPKAWARERRDLRAFMRDRFVDDEALDLTDALDALLAAPTFWPIFKAPGGGAYAFRAAPPLPRKPVFLLDGTAVPSYYGRALRQHGELTFFLPDTPPEERSYVRPAGRLIQIVDGSNSRTRLKGDAHFDRLVASVRAFVARRRHERPDRRTLLITYMDQVEVPYESKFRAALADVGVEVAHYGNIRGLDAFSGWDVVIVGTHRLHPAAYAEEAQSLLGAEHVDLGVGTLGYRVPTRGADTFEVVVDRYLDPAVQCVFEQKTLGELVQAVARSRVLVPGNEDVTVVAYTHFPLPGLLVTPMTMAAFDAVNGRAQPAGPATGPLNTGSGVEDLVKRARLLKEGRRRA
jgi:hypothetical protein